MNNDEKKKLDDKFKKDVIDRLPDYIPDIHKIDIANICSDVMDFLEGKKTKNTIIALDFLSNFYKANIISKMSKYTMGDLFKELKEIVEAIKEDETSIK